jgi:hypothetical protein
MAKTKNEARAAWHEAEEAYRRLIAQYAEEQHTAALDQSAVLAITKARSSADRCFDAYVRRALG